MFSRGEQQHDAAGGVGNGSLSSGSATGGSLGEDGSLNGADGSKKGRKQKAQEAKKRLAELEERMQILNKISSEVQIPGGVVPIGIPLHQTHGDARPGTGGVQNGPRVQNGSRAGRGVGTPHRAGSFDDQLAALAPLPGQVSAGPPAYEPRAAHESLQSFNPEEYLDDPLEREEIAAHHSAEEASEDNYDTHRRSNHRGRHRSSNAHRSRHRGTSNGSPDDHSPGGGPLHAAYRPNGAGGYESPGGGALPGFFPPPSHQGHGEASFVHRDPAGNQTMHHVAFAVGSSPTNKGKHHDPMDSYVDLKSRHSNLLSRKVDAPKGEGEEKEEKAKQEKGKVNGGGFEDGAKTSRSATDSDAVTEDSWMDDVDGEQGKHPKKRHVKASRIPQTMKDSVEISCQFLLGGLSRKSPVRLKCFSICKSPAWDSFFLLTTLTNSIIIAVSPEVAGEAELGQSISVVSVLDLVCVSIFALEVMINIIAYGFCASRTTWLRSSDFHKLDFFVFIATISEYIAGAFGLRGITLRPFRLLRVFKAMIRVRTFSAMKAIIQTLKQGLGQIAVVSLVLTFFVLTWGIFGMAMLRRTFRRRCVTMAKPVPTCGGGFGDSWALSEGCNLLQPNNTFLLPPGDSLFIRGGYPYEEVCGFVNNSTEGEYDGTWTNGEWDLGAGSGAFPLHEGKYHTCNVEAFRKTGESFAFCETRGNPQFGFQHFDHIGGAVLAVFQIAAPDSPQDIIWSSVWAEPEVKYFLWVYFLLISCTCTFLLLGLFVAVVTGTFKRVREGQGAAAFANKVMAMEAILDKSMASSAVGSRGESAFMMQGRQKDDERAEAAFQHAAFRMLFSGWFQNLSALAILVHCGFMSFDEKHNPTPMVNQDAVGVAYQVLCAFFVVELALRGVAYGTISAFWEERYNRVEIALVVLHIVGLVISNEFLVLLPSVRLYKLMRYFPTLEALLQSAIASGKSILNLILFIMVFILCFAVTGRYIFQDTMDTRQSFSSFYVAMLTIFQLLTGDSWSSVVYNAMASRDSYYSQIFAAFFIMIWFIYSKLIISNLFVAVIIENFEVSATIENIQRPGYVNAFRQFTVRSYQKVDRLNATLRTSNYVDDTSNTYTQKRKLDYTLTANANSDYVKATKMGLSGNGQLAALVTQTFADDQVNEDAFEEEERVLYYFKPNNRFRVFCVATGKLFVFDVMIYTAIVVGCFFLIISPPADDLYDRKGNLEVPFIAQNIINPLNQMFTGIFVVEFVVRVMSHGLLQTKNAYLKDGWNVIDSVVLTFALVDETGLLEGSSVAKALRLARALRPLRLMKRNKGMRDVIDALLRTLAPVAYVLLFLVFTALVFTLMGMGLFGGRLHRCSMPGAEYPFGKGMCTGYHIHEGKGILLPRAWFTPKHNFDTFATSIVTLFRVNTIKYVAIMVDLIDITEHNQSPLREFQPYYALFFVTYLLIGVLFVMNLFVGFIVDGFNANKGSTIVDIHYNRFVRLVEDHRPKYVQFPHPRNPLSTALRNFISAKWFQGFSVFCVFCNVAFMLGESDVLAPWFEEVFVIQGVFFMWELVFEVALNIFAYGPGGFYDDPWKAFDLMVMTGTLLGEFASAGSTNVTNFMRGLRLLRVFRLMKMIGPIRVILETLVKSLPQLVNIIIVLLIVYSIFAAFCVNLFGTVKSGYRLGPTANFQTWGNGMLTIYQIVIGDEWMMIMDDCSTQYPECYPTFSEKDVGPEWLESDWFRDKETGLVRDLTWGDCGSTSGKFTFMVLMLVCQTMMLNLFIGMILDNFSFITDEVAEVEDEEWATGPTTKEIVQMAEVFEGFDSGTSQIPLSTVHALMMELRQPLGFKTKYGEVEYGKMEKAAEKLIRAELNVLVRHRRVEVGASRAILTKGLSSLVPSFLKKRVVVAAVGFDELMMTMLYWRKPSMVPNFVKRVRDRVVSEALLMAHAITLKDFFLQPVAQRKRKEINMALASRMEFFRWSNSDANFTRRKHTVGKLRKMAKERAHRSAIYRNLKVVAPERRVTVELEPIDEVPRDMMAHQQALRMGLRVKFPRPEQGIEFLRQKMAKSDVVLRFLDKRNSRIGLVKANFRNCDFHGWHQDSYRNDTLFQPRIRKARIDEGQAVWAQVDFVMKRTKRQSGMAAGGKIIGSITDIQGFITCTEHNAQELPMDPVSFVRFNCGRHPVPDNKKAAEAIEKEEKLQRESTAPSGGSGGAAGGAGGEKKSKDPVVAMLAESLIKELKVCHYAVLEVVGYCGYPPEADASPKAKAALGSLRSTELGAAPQEAEGSLFIENFASMKSHQSMQSHQSGVDVFVLPQDE